MDFFTQHGLPVFIYQWHTLTAHLPRHYSGIEYAEKETWNEEIIIRSKNREWDYHDMRNYPSALPGTMKNLPSGRLAI